MKVKTVGNGLDALERLRVARAELAEAQVKIFKKKHRLCDDRPMKKRPVNPPPPPPKVGKRKRGGR